METDREYWIQRRVCPDCKAEHATLTAARECEHFVPGPRDNETEPAHNPEAGEDNKLADLYEGDTLLTTRLSRRARDRYSHALWYVWGRQDAGDERTKDKLSGHYLGDAIAFAEFAALEAEAYDREQRCMLANIRDQYDRFVADLGVDR
jgi:hypothetical protein